MQAKTRTPAVSFDKILLATDFSDASEVAFERALDLCRTFSASLFILHIFEYAAEVSPQVPGVPIEVANLYEEVQQSLDRLLQSARDHGVVCDGSIVPGLPAQSILETVDALQIKLVVLGTNANRGIERLIFGSTAEAVLRKAPCPVVTVGPRVPNHNKDRANGPVVFATDFHSSTVHAVRYAACVCRVTGAPLHCVTVLPMTMEGGLRSKVIPEVMNQALHHVAMESGTEIACPTCTTVFGPDVPASVALYAKTQRASLIVLGVQSSFGLTSHGPWNATYRLIAEAHCPVLTVTNGTLKQAAFENHGDLIEADARNGQSGDDFVTESGTPQLRASWLKRRRKLVA
jgi:nucleotide-binding universal stress UspA family protein